MSVVFCSGELLAGSVQWLTTGRGLVHRELPNDSLLANGGTWEGFQLWVNLPAKVTMGSREREGGEREKGREGRAVISSDVWVLRKTQAPQGPSKILLIMDFASDYLTSLPSL